jgi:hypothetical protein
VEQKTARAHERKADEGDQEDSVMSVHQAITNAFRAKIQKQQVRGSVDDLCRIGGDNIILCKR